MAWDEEDDRDYTLVVNEKGEWSIWLWYKEIPKGWRSIGVAGKKPEVLKFIDDRCVFGDTESYLKD